MVKRYTPESDLVMYEDEEGAYVSYKDYNSLAEGYQLIRELNALAQKKVRELELDKLWRDNPDNMGR